MARAGGDVGSQREGMSSGTTASGRSNSKPAVQTAVLRDGETANGQIGPAWVHRSSERSSTLSRSVLWTGLAHRTNPEVTCYS